ncbi:hypothetical protein T552_01298 [Pneumocystis carinii B80]|uniref:Protein phosphatase n=1 Tax=Pneumocystis carinii (strain B80) TaxID=1408658 RepID=A0A0W4ZLV3_PNEC8|nr:hypothetical protein T552_01298 [Pneumocystis carinii B80]KTW29343.1 hypothetical protein T552_01298 [Pneumocystis carinii B80]
MSFSTCFTNPPLINRFKAFSTELFVRKYWPVISAASSPRKKAQILEGLSSSLDSSWEILEKGIRNTSQDSFFISNTKEIKGKKETAIGIFDGVGGWQSFSIDVKRFSWGLSDRIVKIYENEVLRGDTVVDSLRKGFKEVLLDKNIIGGGTTVCLGQFYYDKGNIRVLNLGDSGYSIYRYGKLFFKSKIQSHFFNAPFQLSKIPLNDLEHNRNGEKTYIKNEIHDADIYNHDLKHGDVILFATDGVLDNLFFENIQTIITETLINAGIWLKSGQNISPYIGEISKDQLLLATQVSKHIVTFAKKNAQNTKIDTPFSNEARKHRFFYQGGKPDDITALVLMVFSTSSLTIPFPRTLYYI